MSGEAKVEVETVGSETIRWIKKHLGANRKALKAVIAQKRAGNGKATGKPPTSKEKKRTKNKMQRRSRRLNRIAA